MQQILTYTFLVFYTVTILSIVLVIITDNRNPLKTLPWIIVLVFAPVVVPCHKTRLLPFPNRC